jgi:hypothetical protein
MLEGNLLVSALEDILSEPASLASAAEAVKARLKERAALPSDAVKREIEACLLVGSIGDDDHPPRLRPKLHTFFHGVYKVQPAARITGKSRAGCRGL